ncbi:three component ABC system middle component [Pandoraea sp. PE-S2T-3]|uniref:three component ABC system middle component n=1 Tax=Pandoraea sp. PE-S2T-3 TaxID=1986993 RepID=UPI000B406537|nr:three component ABC system middle component [Pandoraea sp. PE-S2T-3]
MLMNDVEQIQNPGLGATLIWRFVCGYIADGRHSRAPLTYAFLVVPLLFNRAALDAVASSYKGLRKVEEKVAGQDALAASLQDSVLAMRALSQESVGIAIRAGLVSLDVKSALMQPLSTSAPTLKEAGAERMLGAAEKLGAWASQVSLREFCFVFNLEL